MRVRRALALTSLLTGLIAVAPGPAVANQGGTDRPVSGFGTGTSTVNLLTGAVTAHGTPIISHLGKTNLSESDVLVPTGPSTFSLIGSATLVAANGGQLFVTVAGTVTTAGAVSNSIVVYTITGGTGRFAGASGTWTLPTHSEAISLTGTTLVTRDTFTVQGHISY